MKKSRHCQPMYNFCHKSEPESATFCIVIHRAASRPSTPDRQRNKSSAVAEMGDRLATVDMGRKVGAAVPLSVGEARSPSNTVWSGLRPTFVPSFIFIHLTVWPQYENVTDRTDRQTDNGPTADEPLYKRSRPKH